MVLGTCVGSKSVRYARTAEFDQCTNDCADNGLGIHVKPALYTRLCDIMPFQSRH